MADDYVTKKDLEEFGEKLEQKLEQKLDQKLHEQLGRLRDELKEAIRDSQTEILRGFHAFQTSWNVRLVKIETDHRNLDVTSTTRLANLEERVYEIERKLMLGGNPPQPQQ